MVKKRLPTNRREFEEIHGRPMSFESPQFEKDIAEIDAGLKQSAREAMFIMIGIPCIIALIVNIVIIVMEHL